MKVGKDGLDGIVDGLNGIAGGVNGWNWGGEWYWGTVDRSKIRKGCLRAAFRYLRGVVGW